MKVIPKDKIKERMITRTAIKCLLPTEVVEKIVNFQGKDANLAVKKYKQVEFAGFGKFLMREYKVKKRIANLEKGIEKAKQQIVESTSEHRTKYLTMKLNGMIEQLAYYKGKI